MVPQKGGEKTGWFEKKKKGQAERKTTREERRGKQRKVTSNHPGGHVRVPLQKELKSWAQMIRTEKRQKIALTAKKRGIKNREGRKVAPPYQGKKIEVPKVAPLCRRKT